MAILGATPGDVIPIPAQVRGESGFVLSRVLYRAAVTVVEVFDGFRTDFLSVAENLDAFGFRIEYRLFAPVFAAFHFHKYFGTVRWPVLGKVGTPTEWKQRFERAEFAEVDYQTSGRFERGNIRCKESGWDRRPLEGSTIYSNPQLIHRVNLHLSGRLARGEPLTPLRMASIMASEAPGWLEGEFESCRRLADEVGTRFKETPRKAR